MSGALYFRIRIRAADDASDLLTISSLRTGTNPYLLGPPSGDGQRLDPITGKSSIGAYTVRVVDQVTSGTNRVVTANLVDSSKRQQLIGRRAYIESSTDGSTWSVMVAGWVNRVRLIGALTFEFSVGETQRIEQNLEIFKTVTPTYDKVSCICGGPVRGGFGPIGNYGPWRMRVAEVTADKFVRLKYLSGYQRRVLFGVIQIPTGGYDYVAGGIQPYEDERVNAISREYYAPIEGYSDSGIFGYYPQLRARVEQADGTLIGVFTPLNRIDPPTLTNPGDHIALVDNSDLNLQWDGVHGDDGTGSAPDQPDDESIVYVYVYPFEINENNPIHLTGHPCDIITGLWGDAGLAYSSTDAATAKAAIGPYLCDLRVKQSYKLNDFVTLLSAFFGLGVRFNSSGERSLVSTRIRSSTAPTTIITMDDLRSVEPSIFDVDEKSQVNKVTLKTEHYSLWSPAKYGADSAHPIDELVVTPITSSITDADSDGEHEQVFELPGQIRLTGLPRILQDLRSLVTGLDTVSAYAVARATEVFDRRRTGAIVGELACLRGVTAVPGDEITLDLDHLPNDNDRGGERIVQVLGRTETPGGPTLYIEDAGTSVQPSTVPAYTIVKDTATDAKRFALISITNASSLITDGSSCRVEMAIGSSPTSWLHVATLTPAQLADTTSWTSPQCDAGAVVNVRMRAEEEGKRPSAYGTAKSVTLTALTAPASLNVVAVTGNAAEADASWTAGDGSALPVFRWRLTADSVYDHSVTLPKGSTKYRVRGLDPSGAYTFQVFQRELPPWAGESTAITDTLTMGSTAPDCTAPENPRAFAGSIDPATGGLVVDGTYGLQVNATELPGFVVFEVAVETSAGAGTYGSYTAVPRGTIQAVQNARTVWTGLAPNDGKKRRLRAKATAPGKDDSTYTTAVDVDPWTATTPTDEGITCPAITLTSVTAMQAGVGNAKIRVSFTEPDESWLDRLVYSVRFKEPNGDYGEAAIVVGTKAGPDFIDAQYGLVYEVTPSTVTTGVDGSATATAGTLKTITMPGAGAAPLIVPTAGASSIEYAITYDTVTTSIEVWSAQFTDDPGTASQENATGATLVATLRRGDGRTSLSLSVDATNDWRGTTFIPYAGVQRGDPIPKHDQRNGSAGVPADLGTVTNDSATTMTVTNKIILAGTHTSTDQIETYVGGVVRGSLYSITSADVTAGFALVETTGLSSDTDYSFTYKAVRSGIRSTNFTTAFIQATDSGQLDAPTITAARDGSSPDAVAIIGITPGANNPAGTLYTIEVSTTGLGSWSVKTTSATEGDQAVSHTSSQTFFRAKANGNAGGTTSDYSGTAILAE